MTGRPFISYLSGGWWWTIVYALETSSVNPHTQPQSHPNIPSDDAHTEPDKDNMGRHLKAGLSLGTFFVLFLKQALS
jgi:hypothetical protein